LNKVLSDERLGAKLRVTENRCVIFNHESHPEEDRQVGRNIGGLENVSYLHLCLIYRYIYIYIYNL